MIKRQIEKKYQTSIDLGLDEAEAKKRLVNDGLNEIEEDKKEIKLIKFFKQFNDPLIYILILASIISFFLKEYKDAGIILFVVIINSVIGYIQEEKATKALEELKKLTNPYAFVKRNGRWNKILARELVVGDVIKVGEGMKIPADAKIVDSHDLLVDESSLTGESEPVLKICDNKRDGKEGSDYIFMSTLVLKGNGEAVVTKIGKNSEIGKVANMLKSHKTIKTPLQKRLKELSKILGIITICICVLLFLLALIQKRDVLEMLLTSISLAVAAIPEGLPAVVTIVLASGVQKLSKAKMIVKKLHAVETLGAISVILTDKTGTLTENKLKVKEVNVNLQTAGVDELKENYEVQLIKNAVFACNDVINSMNEIGDPTEVAMLNFSSNSVKQSNIKRLMEKAFSSERQMMSVLIQDEEKIIQYTKGSFEKIISNCDYIYLDREKVKLDKRIISLLNKQNKEMALKAMRVIAVATNDKKIIVEENMTFVGFLGMIDSPKKGVKKTIKDLKNAGIKPLMITGDNINTAYAIGKELHIVESFAQCIEGKDINNGNINAKRVFARVTPLEKIEIVKAMQKQGHLVAMTGDGVNDAPSLKQADVGIAMGKSGTDVSKHAADMVLQDDNYCSIYNAIREGRGIYENIKKTTLFLLSSNFAEILMMMLGVIFTLPMPLIAIHILWINLITDSLPSIALGVDKTSDSIMKEKPRNKKETLFSRGGYSILLIYGIVITSATLISYLVVPFTISLISGGQNIFSNIRSILLYDEYVLTKSRTFAFITLGMSQLFHMIGMSNIKVRIKEIIKKKNLVLLFTFLIGLILQVLVTEIPFFSNVFKTARISFMEWLFLLSMSSFPLIMHEIFVGYYKKI